MSNPMQSVVPKAAGKAAAADNFKSLRGVFKRLAEQHHAVAGLLTQALHAEELIERKELWIEIRRALISHEQGELLEVYPLLESNEKTRDIARRHAEHANVLEDAISELDDVGAGSVGWRPGLERVSALVKEHVALEEQELFPRAQQALGEDGAKKLELAYVRAQQLAAKAFG